MIRGVFRTFKKELFAKIVNGLKLFISFYPRELYPGCLTGFWIRLWLFEIMKVNSSCFHTILIHDLYEKVAILPVNTGRKLKVNKTFRRRSGHLLNVLCTFNLRAVSTGLWRSRVAFPTVQKQSQCVLGTRHCLETNKLS